MARSNKFAFPAKERGVVNGKQHIHGWLINRDPGQSFGHFGIGNGITNVKTFDAGNSADFARRYTGYFYPAQAFKYLDIFDPHFSDRAVALTQANGFTFG